MPRHLSRQEPTWTPHDDELARTPAEAVPVNGVDATAAHRAHMRAMTTAAQERERRKDQTMRAHQVGVLAAEAERGHRRPRGAGWPATLRSIREGREE
jgi:hypothetical protein